MKTIKSIIILSISMLVLSCSDEGKNTVDINTKDVKGTIEAPDMKKQIKGSLSTNDGNFEQAILIFEGSEISIFPSTTSFDKLIADLEEKSERKFETIDIIEKGDNFIFYKSTKEAYKEGNEDEVGYLFTVVYDNPSGDFYHVECNGGTPLDPVKDESKARSLLKIAQTFKPSK